MKKLLLAMLAAASIGATASAETLRLAPGVPQAHPSYSHGYVPFVDYLAEESGDRLDATILGPEVVSVAQMKDALQTRVAQIGLILPLYFPADFPNIGLAAEIALVGQEPMAMAAALTEYIVTCEACQRELRKFGIVYLGAGSTDVYHLLTTKPVRALEDLKGLRLRSGGAPWSRWAENFGAVPVSLPIGETFEAISQGTIDGTMATYGDLLSFRLVELVSHVTDVSLGTFHAVLTFSVGSAAWAGLGAEDRAAVARAANRSNFEMTERWANELTSLARAAASKAGIESIKPPADLVAASNAFAAADAKTAGELSAERFGLSETQAKVNRVLALIEKWNAIVREVDGDPQSVAARVQKEVWSKVDYEVYGG